ncbi:MAG: hypothetical protein A2138_15465 [Deltaproteobacteria bacterium RBG_16_71_12]|nr:MAG: hypothetical protein A2138_15465 [Deltaproteobacteria bacterium RBG_16_71_12]
MSVSSGSVGLLDASPGRPPKNSVPSLMPSPSVSGSSGSVPTSSSSWMLDRPSPSRSKSSIETTTSVNSTASPPV